MNLRLSVHIGTLSAIFLLLAGSALGQDPPQANPVAPQIQGPAGGPLALPNPPDGTSASISEVLKFKMYALLGQSNARGAVPLDADLKAIEGVIKGLPYTGYERITVEERETPDGTDTQFPINPVYSLVVHPMGTDEQGAAKLDIHVDLMQDGKVIKALTAQATAKPGDALLLRGMPLPPGELVIVLQRDAGDQKSEGGEGDESQEQQQQQKESEQAQDQQQKDKDEEKKEEQEKEQQQAQAEQQEKQEETKQEDAKADDSEKKDTKNLESILQSLEEVDRKEQAEVRNRRDRIDFKGDWW